MKEAPIGTLVGYDYISKRELFRVERPTATAEGSSLPVPGDTYKCNGRIYKVKGRLEDATDKMWKITVSDEGQSTD
jgi:hypothetical protein